MRKNKNYGVQLGRAFTHNAVTKGRINWEGILMERAFY